MLVDVSLLFHEFFKPLELDLGAEEVLLILRALGMAAMSCVFVAIVGDTEFIDGMLIFTYFLPKGDLFFVDLMIYEFVEHFL